MTTVRQGGYVVIMTESMKTVTSFLWAPTVSGALAATLTWLVWFYTTLPCTPETALALKCRPTPLALYLSASALHHCIIHASIAITITGGSDLMLFLRERRRNDKMMELIKTAIDQAAEERRLAFEQLKQGEARAAEERRQGEARAAEERRQAEERAAEERRLGEERAAEERRQAAVERQAFLDALSKFADAIGQNGRNQE